MDIPNFNKYGTSGITTYRHSKYDLGGNSRTNEASPPRPCRYFLSGHCRAGNRCSHSHDYQTLDKFNNCKPDRTVRMDCRVYIVPDEEGSKQSGTVNGPNIAAASSSEYDPVTDGLDLINSIISEEEAKMALTSELPPTSNVFGVALHETYRNSKSDLGGNSRTNEASPPRPCRYFFSGRCRAGNRCSHSHNYQTLDKFNNYKPDRTVHMDCRIYIVPDEEGSKQSGTVNGPNIAAASSSEYDPVTDGLDLINSIISEEEAKMALTSELPPPSNVFGVALHETDHRDAELMVNVISRQSRGKEQFADCKNEKQNILKAGGSKEGKDGNKVADNKGDTDGKSLRAFRSALVEFVKELLSPTWKEKKIEKEAYIKIVKKVEDKVISSFQSSIHIPRRQEDINNYLAARKPKISEIVQAYIEREMAKANVA